MSFEEYLEYRLNMPVHAQYDPNGNSPRAVVYRGLSKEIAWQYRNLPNHIKGVIHSFDGLDTPLGYFVQLPVYVFLLPILPVIWGIRSHKTSLKVYKDEYYREQGK